MAGLGLGGLFSVRSRLPVDEKDRDVLREDLVDELKDKLRLEKEKVCEYEEVFEQLDARLAKQEENFERVVKEKRALERSLDEFKNATKSCEINDNEFGKLSAKETKCLLDSSAKELQLTKLKLNDLEKQLGQNHELLRRTTKQNHERLEETGEQVESDKNELVEIFELEKKEMQEKFEWNLSHREEEHLKELASVQKRCEQQLDASKMQLDASKQQMDASKQEMEVYVENNTKSSAEQTKSSANEIRIMLNSITKDAALEKEAAVEDAKKTLNQEWELKMREMLHDYAADQSGTMDRAIKEKDEQIKLMKETMIETLEKEKGQGATEISKIVMHLERTQKATLQEALVAEREKLTNEHNADLGKVLDEYSALERSKNEMEQRHEHVLAQIEEDKHSTRAEITDFKKQLKEADVEHSKELGKILDRLGRLVQDKAVTEEERDLLKAAKQTLTQNLQDAKETITMGNKALLQVTAERDTAQEELQKAKSDLESLAETLSETMEELDSCKETMAQLVTATRKSDQQCKTMEAEIKDMESEMEALSRETERMDALLLEAEKTKAETDKALATLREVEDREAALTAEKAMLQVNLNAYKINLAELTKESNESEQLFGVQLKALLAENLKVKALEEELVKQVKALEEENEKLGAENEQLAEKLEEQCQFSAVGAEEAEESMTLMYKWQESYHTEQANLAKTQEQLEETEADLKRMSDHALDMEEQQNQARAFFKQIKEEKVRLEAKVVRFDELTQENERAVLTAKKMESSLALTLADLELLRMETKERAKLDLEREEELERREKMEQDAVQQAAFDLDFIIKQHTKPGAKKALAVGECLALPAPFASPFGADEQESKPGHSDGKKGVTTSTSKAAAELPDFLKGFGEDF